MKFKKILSFLCAATLCFSMTACGKEDTKKTTKKEETENEKEVVQEIRDIPSTELVKEMSIGWNLGNTLDATGSGLEAETYWQSTTTTKEMIDLLKTSGFNVLRVPTTWEGHMDDEGNIDVEWMDRVQEIVDYGIDNDLFVILNIHHEEWHFPSNKDLDAKKAKLKKVWEQIAERFKNYDEHLIFEGLNEPRKKGTNVEWNGGDREGQDVVNQFNAVFVETVRNSGGNNKLRHLMIPTYAASSSSSAMKAFKMPDENDDKLIVSVHGYAPYNFALNTKGTAEWSVDNAADTNAIDQIFRDIENYFLYEGYAVIIGEFGSINKLVNTSITGDNTEDRIAHAEYYMKKAREYGIPCVWWDNHAFVGNGENFGLMDRGATPPCWKFPEIVTALTGVEVE